MYQNGKHIKPSANPYLIFLPFLVIYLVLVLVFPTTGLAGDEDVYLKFARNLAMGSYSPPAPHTDLAKGPGYPLLLLPFVALHIPLIFITILNAVFYYLSLILVYKSLQRFVSNKFALVFTLFWGCYFNVVEILPFTIAETFAPFLVALLVYCLLNAFDPGNFKKRKRYLYFSGFTFGYLVLTKPIFGYVLLVMLAGTLLLWLFNRSADNYRKTTVILLIAFATTIPYLIYTYNLTGRKLYWGTAGGNNLYWMSTPYEAEYGSWINFPLDTVSKSNIIAGAEDSIVARHQKDYDEISKYDGAAQDDAYKKIAVANIKAHPVKFIKNCIYNVGRMVFNYPFSYKSQKPGTLIRFPFTGILMALFLFCIVPTIRNWKKLSFSLRFMLLFSMVYFGGSIFGSAETRMLNVIVPVLLVHIAYILSRTVRVNFRLDETNAGTHV